VKRPKGVEGWRYRSSPLSARHPRSSDTGRPPHYAYFSHSLLSWFGPHSEPTEPVAVRPSASVCLGEMGGRRSAAARTLPVTASASNLRFGSLNRRRHRALRVGELLRMVRFPCVPPGNHKREREARKGGSEQRAFDPE